MNNANLGTKKPVSDPLPIRADLDGEAEYHYFCSTECRETAPAPYRYADALLPLKQVAPGTICENCGSFIVAPKEISELRDLKAPEQASEKLAEKSPREIAEEVAQIPFNNPWTANQLINAIETALRDRDERAAKIADAMRPSGGRMWTDEQAACFEALSACATAIRGVSAKTEVPADAFHCEHCEQDFTEHPHATDDGYWLCHPCWLGLQGEQGICECRCHGYHEIRATSCQHCS